MKVKTIKSVLRNIHKESQTGQGRKEGEGKKGKGRKARGATRYHEAGNTGARSRKTWRGALDDRAVGGCEEFEEDNEEEK